MMKREIDLSGVCRESQGKAAHSYSCLGRVGRGMPAAGTQTFLGGRALLTGEDENDLRTLPHSLPAVLLQ